MEATLQAEKRDGRGKNEARRLRAAGRIPAVLYGTQKGKATEIAVDPKALLRILHADFYQVAMDKTLTVTVPIVLKGEPKGAKQQGGIVDFVNREIEIECLPGDIPESIAVDIGELMLNQGLRVR